MIKYYQSDPDRKREELQCFRTLMKRAGKLTKEEQAEVLRRSKLDKLSVFNDPQVKEIIKSEVKAEVKAAKAEAKAEAEAEAKKLYAQLREAEARAELAQIEAEQTRAEAEKARVEAEANLQKRYDQSCHDFRNFVRRYHPDLVELAEQAIAKTQNPDELLLLLRLMINATDEDAACTILRATAA